MEAIEQLKTLRGEALQRLQTNIDYKLMTALDTLITDLETVIKPAHPKFMIIEEEADDDEPQSASESVESVDEAFEKITAELADEEEEDKSEDSKEDSRWPSASFN